MRNCMLSDEWIATRRRSLAILPVAVALFAILSAVVYAEGLHRSEDGFLAGVLIGIFGYWVGLELMTVVKVGRLLRAAAGKFEAESESAT